MNRLVLFMLLLSFWLLLTWSGDPGAAYIQDVAVGLLVAVMITWAFGDTASEGAFRWWQPARYGWALIYLFVLAGSIVKANLEVAYRVLHPSMPIRPGIVRVTTKLRSPAARTVLGHSLTLCPGTLTVDIQEDGTMFVHWIYVRSQNAEEATREVLGRFEWYLERIFA